MSLWTETVARVSVEKLRALTNPDNRGQTSINTVVADLAVLDVEAAFRLHAEQDYNGTDKRHVAIGVRGVIAHLMSYGAGHGDGTQAAMDRFEKQLVVLRNTTSRARLSPATDSRLVPSDEFAGGRERKPDFDRTRFGGMVPDNRDEDDDLLLP